MTAVNRYCRASFAENRRAMALLARPLASGHAQALRADSRLQTLRRATQAAWARLPQSVRDAVMMP